MSLHELADRIEKDRNAREAVRTLKPGDPGYEAAKEYLDRRFGLDLDVAPKIRPVARVAQQAAEVHGAYLDPQAAADVALAVLQHSDDTFTVTMQVTEVLWEYESVRASIVGRLNRRLADDVRNAGQVPVALPSAELSFDPRTRLVTVIMSVPVRRPL